MLALHFLHDPMVSLQRLDPNVYLGVWKMRLKKVLVGWKMDLFEDGFPIEHGDVRASYLSLSKGIHH